MTLNNDSSDEAATNRRRERCMELAAMFKEKKKGSKNELNATVASFCLQEGVTKKTSKEYLSLLFSAKLLHWQHGHGQWWYDVTSEWDLFKIEI